MRENNIHDRERFGRSPAEWTLRRRRRPPNETDCNLIVFSSVCLFVFTVFIRAPDQHRCRKVPTRSKIDYTYRVVLVPCSLVCGDGR